TRTCIACCGPRCIRSRNRAFVWDLAGHDQTLSQTTPRNRLCPAQRSSRSSTQEICSVAIEPSRSVRGSHRCHIADPLPTLGRATGDGCQHVHHEPCDQAGRLDPKKKTLGASERNQEARTAWQEQLKHLDARNLVVIDECGSNIALTPLYARAPKGKRATGSVPRNRGKNTTLIAALTWSGVGESMIIEGSANAVAFEQYVEEILVPSLTMGQIV